MSASLVGSEMCIRDSCCTTSLSPGRSTASPRRARLRNGGRGMSTAKARARIAPPSCLRRAANRLQVADCTLRRPSAASPAVLQRPAPPRWPNGSALRVRRRRPSSRTST
eukprot:11655854-Alexandrium_andersonii.AAC.1